MKHNYEKQAIAHIEQWKNSTTTSLSGAYKKPSSKKKVAWAYCENLCNITKQGKNLKVVSHNIYMFTAGFEFVYHGKTMFMFITPSSDTAVLMI